MDRKDASIIAQLRLNGRASIKEIAKATGIRPSTVHQRIQKLLSSGIIDKFTIKLDNQRVDENFIVFVMIKTKTEIGGKVLNDHRVREVFGVTGQYDLILKLKCKDVDAFNAFILQLRKQPGITETLTMVSTATIKEEL